MVRLHVYHALVTILFNAARHFDRTPIPSMRAGEPIRLYGQF